MGNNCSNVAFHLGDTAIQLYEFTSQPLCIKGNNVVRLAVTYRVRTVQYRNAISTTQQCNNNEIIHGVLMHTPSSELVQRKSGNQFGFLSPALNSM